MKLSTALLGCMRGASLVGAVWMAGCAAEPATTAEPTNVGNTTSGNEVESPVVTADTTTQPGPSESDGLMSRDATPEQRMAPEENLAGCGRG